MWALTADYCICKNTRLAAFYQQTKNCFSIHGLLKRSSVQLSKLKSSAFRNPIVTQLTKSRCGRCPREQNTRASITLLSFCNLRRVPHSFIVMSSIQQSNNYNLNCLDTVFLVSTRNRTTLETLITSGSALSN